MSTQPNDPQATDEDLDVPAEEADAVSGGITFNASEDEDQDPQGQMQAI